MARDGEQALGVVRAHEERDLCAGERAQRVRDGQRPVDVSHAHLGPAVHAEEHAGLGQQPLRHPEVLEVVDGEGRALVQDHVADAIAEAAGRVQHRAEQRHHRAVLLVDRLLLLPAPFFLEEGREHPVRGPPAQRPVLGHREDSVVTSAHQPVRLVDGRSLAEGRGGLQHHHDVGLLAGRLHLLHGVDDHRLQAGDVGGQVARAQERHLAAVGLRHLRHAKVVGRDHHAVDARRRLGRVQGMGQQRPVAQPLDVQVGHAVRPAPRGHDGHDPQAVLHDIAPRGSPQRHEEHKERNDLVTLVSLW